MPFKVHPQMLRHACGYKLANDAHGKCPLLTQSGHKASDVSADNFELPHTT